MLETPTIGVDDGFVGKKAAAAFLSLSVRTFEKYVPQVPHFKLGGKILFRRSELVRWMERYRQVTGEELNTMVDEVLGKLGI